MKLDELEAVCAASPFLSAAAEEASAASSMEDLDSRIPLHARLSLMMAGVSFFAENCPWGDMDGLEWCMLVARRPEYAPRCILEQLPPVCWPVLLAARPDAAESVDLNRMDMRAWMRLLLADASFADRAPLDRLDSAQWARLLASGGAWLDLCPAGTLEPGHARWAENNNPGLSGKLGEKIK